MTSSVPDDSAQLGTPSAGTPRHEPATADDALTARDVAIASAGFAAEVARDVALDLLWNVLVWAALILSIALPVVGLALGVLFLIFAVRGGRSKVLPIMTIAFSIVAWAMMQSPLGVLGVFLALRS